MDDYIKRIKITSINKDFLIDYNKTDLMDQRMNALLIIWIYHPSIFKSINNINNPYLSYITELTSDIENVNLNYLYIENNTLVANINDFYFIINHNNHDVNITLPRNLQNKNICKNEKNCQ